jgi:hypothetical protein
MYGFLGIRETTDPKPKSETGKAGAIMAIKAAHSI